ncbi:MAG: hypothetical protein LBQ15_10755 [Clostridium sp.]|jgi:hypothetical protein|nr:hypothetical protein [Clostridium sp.]
MQTSIDWVKISGCTLEERKKAIPYINRLLDLKNTFEKFGIEGFAEFISSSSNVFEKTALNLVMQGCMPEMCRTILYYLLASSKLENLPYLKNVIFAEFILMIQKGHVNNQDVKRLLLSFLGIECADEFLH